MRTGQNIIIMKYNPDKTEGILCKVGLFTTDRDKLVKLDVQARQIINEWMKVFPDSTFSLATADHFGGKWSNIEPLKV